jgi:hypothetical protein
MSPNVSNGPSTSELPSQSSSMEKAIEQEVVWS